MHSCGKRGWVTSQTFRKTVASREDDQDLSIRQIADQLGHAALDHPRLLPPDAAPSPPPTAPTPPKPLVDSDGE